MTQNKLSLLHVLVKVSEIHVQKLLAKMMEIGAAATYNAFGQFDNQTPCMSPARREQYLRGVALKHWTPRQTLKETSEPEHNNSCNQTAHFLSAIKIHCRMRTGRQQRLVR
jgi:hypothetical protein